MTVLDQFSLKTKVAIVTGGEGLIGRMICETIRELGGTALSIDIKGDPDHRLDITDGVAVNNLSKEIPPIDILVNCAVGNQQPVQDAAANGVADAHQIEQRIRRIVGKWVNDEYRRRPMIIPVVVEV